jgi:hypothetical protein
MPSASSSLVASSSAADGVSQQRSIRALATVELQHVLTYLSSVDLLRVARVTRSWYAAVDSPLVWRHLTPSSEDVNPAMVPSSELVRPDFFTSAMCQSYWTHSGSVLSPWYVSERGN